MEKGCYVKEIGVGSEVRGLFIVSQATQSQSRNGPYWRLTLTDASGNLEAKIWHPLSTDFTDIPIGSLVWAEGHANLFREQIQLAVERMRFLNEDECDDVDHTTLMPASPFPLDAMQTELDNIAKQEFTYAPWRRLVHGILNDTALRAAFRICPAAKAVHHAYVGGLLEHTLSVVKLCRHIADHYPALDRQTLLAGALFHDIGKLREFSGGIANDYTDEGRLLGHLMLGVEILTPFLTKSGLDEALQCHLKHLVLSHHGELAFGAVREPHSPEAMALHYADNLDAKMAQCRNLFIQMDTPGAGWTPWQPTLGRPVYKAAQTPQSVPTSPRKKKVKEQSLSLLDCGCEK
ncbi:MAG: HD domain-containing protein [Desulfovibrio sp.]|nr:HD domain-containing protein [Desulfovibrio sp.]